ncbi:hypothetical protein C479_15667 [Halovivax asiaticus JCM 14624]|uniref:Uncharacterized protein n=1 Tax=Halovivax asiaticus JCM 14624 TaxID=1227490 RepID=M0B9B4_9EURY|nr:DUF58 domain-containing protein [Halovivax asiaticus]ELZ07057.1 hypothetical protein C479_15667 [Halovivax asiaticus JCM 14624]
MRARTTVAAAVAVAWFGVGLTILLGGVPGDVSVAILLLVGTLAAMVAVWSVVKRRGTQRRFDLPAVERGRPVPIPGTNLEDAIGEFHERTTGAGQPGRRAATGLYGLAIAVLTRFRGLTKADATALLHDGTWTDDPFAAGLLSPTRSVPYPEGGLRTRLLRYTSFVPTAALRNRVTRLIETRSRYAIAIERTAAEVSRISDEARGSTVERGAPDRIEPSAERTDVRTTDRPVETLTEVDYHQTAYWNGIGLVALLPVTVGLYVREPAVVMLGAVAVAFAGVASITQAPKPDIAVSRTVEPTDPEPGEHVEVTVTIENTSTSTLFDLRYVDGVPAALSVVAGSARIGTALGAGESVSFEYTLKASRGSHEFDPGLAVTRDLFQSEERATYVPSESVLVTEPLSTPLSHDPALRRVAGTFGSSFTTDDSGDGTAFHSVREYRRGDPLNRIDWNRRARTGELATLEFEEEYAGSVLLLVDARTPAYVAHEAGALHAVDRAVTACSRLAPTLLEEGHHVGLAAIGPAVRTGATDSSAGECWIAPHTGRAHERRLAAALSGHPQFSPTVPTGATRWRTQLRQLRRRLSSNVQVLFISPLSDGVSVEIARRIEASGYAVSVLSPDATATATVSHRLARVSRLLRRFDLQRNGIPVIQWDADETIEGALAGDVATVGCRTGDLTQGTDGSERESSTQTGNEPAEPNDARTGSPERSLHAVAGSSDGDRS